MQLRLIYLGMLFVQPKPNRCGLLFGRSTTFVWPIIRICNFQRCAQVNRHRCRRSMIRRHNHSAQHAANRFSNHRMHYHTSKLPFSRMDILFSTIIKINRFHVREKKRDICCSPPNDYIKTILLSAYSYTFFDKTIDNETMRHTWALPRIDWFFVSVVFGCHINQCWFVYEYQIQIDCFMVVLVHTVDLVMVREWQTLPNFRFIG